MALLVDLTATSHVDSHSHHRSEYKPIGLQEELKSGNKLSADSHSHHQREYKPIGLPEELKSTGIDKLSAAEGGVELGGNDESRQAEELVKLKQRLVSQVLEIGIIFHSVIIGVTMGMSQNQCTIRPLVAALAFHQIFEGMGLGGCIAQVIN